MPETLKAELCFCLVLAYSQALLFLLYKMLYNPSTRS